MKEPNKFHNNETEKSLIKPVTRQNISSCLVLHPRSSCTMHLMLLSERLPIDASSCMTISGGRTEQHVVIGSGELARVDYYYVDIIFV